MCYAVFKPFSRSRIMNPKEMLDLQDNLRASFGETYTVEVDKVLSHEERAQLITHIRHELGDSSATIKIIEPVTAPIFDFNYSIVPKQQNTVQEAQSANKSVSESKEGWVYGDNLVVMQNRLLNAITDLSFNERRLIMYLSHIVRKTIDNEPSQRTFVVTGIEFEKEYGGGRNNVYDTLQQVADSLLNKAFFFWSFGKNELGNRKGSSWVAECEYIKRGGRIEITLTDTVTEMLTVFDTHNPFTKYEREYIINLGSYGIILFELINSCLFLKGKKKSYSMKYLREKFNCTDKYSRPNDFKKHVIDKAIEEIEEHTPLRISYTQVKDGIFVSELVFTFKDITAKKTNEIDNKKPSLNAKQASKYDFQLRGIHNIVGTWKGDYDDCQKRINKELQDPEHFEKYLPYLIELGYMPS